MKCKICGKETANKYCDICANMIALARSTTAKHRCDGIWFCGDSTMAQGSLKTDYINAYNYFKKYHDLKVKDAEESMCNYKSDAIPVDIRKMFCLYNFIDKCTDTDRTLGSQMKTCRCCGQIMPKADYRLNKSISPYCSYCRSIVGTEDLPTYRHNPIAIYQYKSLLYREHVRKILCDK